jgi:hypothetical protein
LKKNDIYVYPDSANLEDVAQLASAIAMSSLKEVSLVGLKSIASRRPCAMPLLAIIAV